MAGPGSTNSDMGSVLSRKDMCATRKGGSLGSSGETRVQGSRAAVEQNASRMHPEADAAGRAMHKRRTGAPIRRVM